MKRQADDELLAKKKAEIDAQTQQIEKQLEEEKKKKDQDDLINKSIALAKEQQKKTFEATVAMANQVSHEENSK